MLSTVPNDLLLVNSKLLCESVWKVSVSYAPMHHKAKDMVCSFTLPEKSYRVNLNIHGGLLKPPQRCDAWSDDWSKFDFSYT